MHIKTAEGIFIGSKRRGVRRGPFALSFRSGRAIQAQDGGGAHVLRRLNNLSGELSSRLELRETGGLGRETAIWLPVPKAWHMRCIG